MAGVPCARYSAGHLGSPPLQRFVFLSPLPWLEFCMSSPSNLWPPSLTPAPAPSRLCHPSSTATDPGLSSQSPHSTLRPSLPLPHLTLTKWWQNNDITPGLGNSFSSYRFLCTKPALVKARVFIFPGCSEMLNHHNSPT